MVSSEKRHAVVLMNLGGPATLSDVKPFLRNLFGDRDIFRPPFPWITQGIFAWAISTLRASKVGANYALIGGGSPILKWTNLQAQLLEKALSPHGSYTVFVAMRYSPPFIEEIAEQIVDGEFDSVLLLPLYPQYSLTTTGSSVNEWRRSTHGSSISEKIVQWYYHNDLYLDAVVERIHEGLRRFPPEAKDIRILFSAHGIPRSFTERGDPYEAQIIGTVEGLKKRFEGEYHCYLSYQSRVGPGKWLGPTTHETISQMGADGLQSLLVVPISFVSDHFETLYELDILYRRLAENVGIKHYIVSRGLNDSPKFIEALRRLVLESE